MITTFFRAHLDYLNISCGMAFLLLSVVCFAIRKDDKTRLPWWLLGLFALTQGLHLWLCSLLIFSTDQLWIAITDVSLEVASYLCLVEFARISRRGMRERTVGVWIYFPLSLIPTLGTFYGVNGLLVASRYSLGLVGGIWASLAVFRASSQGGLRSKERYTLQATGALLGIFALVTSLTAPSAEFFLARWLNEEVFGLLTGVPASVIGGFLGVLLLVVVLLYGQMSHGEMLVYVNWGIPSLIGLMFLGWLFTESAGRYGEAQKRQEFLSRVQTAAAALRPSDIAHLRGSEADLGHPEFERLRSQIRAIRAGNRDSRFVYLVGLRDGKVFFFTDSEPETSADYSPPGQVYDEASPELVAMFSRGEPFVEGPLEDRWGVWVTGYAAVRESPAKPILAVLGMDVEAKEWLRAVCLYRFGTILIVLFTCGLGVGCLTILQLVRNSAARIAASEKRFRILFENAPEAVFILDAQTHRILLANRFMAQWLGYSNDELQGMTLEDVVEPDAKMIAENIERILREGAIEISDRRYRKKDGTLADVGVRATTVRFQEREAIIAFVRDITDIKRAQQEVQEQRDWFRTTLASIGDGVIATDPEGNIIFMNGVAERITGWTAQEARGRPIDTVFRVVDERTRQPVESPISRALREGVVAELQSNTLLLSRGGTEIPIDDTGGPIRGSSGVVHGAVLIFRDITERKRAERSLEERAQLAALSADVGLALTQGITLSEMLRKCADAIAQRLKPASTLIWVFDSQSQNLTLEASASAPAQTTDLQIQASSGQSTIARIAQEKQPYVSNNLLKDTDLQGLDWARRNGFYAFAGYPMTVGEDLVGVLAIFSKSPFSDFALKTLSSLSNSIAIGIQRKHAEDALRESEEKFRSISDSANDAIIMLDSNGNISHWNPMAQRIFGYSGPEVIGRELHMFLAPPQYREAYQKAFAHFRKTGQGAVIGQMRELTALRKDGTEFPMELSLSAVHLHGGWHALGILRDISARKEAERALERSHKLLNALTHAQSQFITDVPAHVLFDRLQAHLLSLTQSEFGFIGEVLYDSEGKPYLRALAVTAIAARQDFHEFRKKHFGEELIFRKLDSLYGEVLKKGRPVISNDPASDPRRFGLPEGHPPIHSFLGLPFYKGARLVGMVGIANRPGGYDEALVAYLQPFITTCANIIEAYQNDQRRKEVEETLRISYRAMAATSEGIIISDYQKPDNPVIYVNAAFERMTGYSRNEVIGKNARFLLCPESDAAEHERLRKAIENGLEWVGEILNQRKDGTRFWNSLSVTPIRDSAGDVTHYVGVLSDITGRKRMEEVLRQAKEAAEAASRAKSEFLSNMSHEIRTPMNAIIGIADLLSETPLSPEQRRYVNIFRSAGETLLHTIDDILDLSKIESGQVTLESVPFDLREEVEKVCDIFALRAHEKGLELACYVRPDVPIDLVGDPARLRQILNNLIGNAVKFTEKGEVVVEVHSREGQSPSDPTVQLEFSVRDTGIGIPADKMERLFQRFSQADSSTTRKYGGTGLGLAIAKHLVELMHGQISVQSKKGEGSTFRFTACFQRGMPTKRPAPDLKDLKALVVDDNATNRLILREVLAGLGAQVEEAADGQAALAELRKAQSAGASFDLVFLDNHMPGMNGFDTLHEAEKLGISRPRTAIMLTSNRSAEDLARCRGLGITAYLVKPIKRGDLLDAIHAGLAGIKMGAAEPAPASASASTADSRALKILLAEDSEDNRLLIETYLKKGPYQVEVAVNGEQAVQKFTTGEYDLVLMDMQMPVMDGYTATSAIRQWEQKQNRKPTPIIALSAYALKSEIEKSLKAGCTAHVTKPIRKAKLIEIIEQYAKPTTP